MGSASRAGLTPGKGAVPRRLEFQSGLLQLKNGREGERVGGEGGGLSSGCGFDLG